MRALAIANRNPRLRLDRHGIAKTIAVLDCAARSFRGGCPPGELSVVFLTDRALAQIHADFLADPTPTDVITFPGDPSAGQAGEICVSADAARRQSHGKSAAASSRELTLYLVHAWLHLAGYDDRTAAQRRLMRRAETRALRLLGKTRVLPAFRLRGLGAGK